MIDTLLLMTISALAWLGWLVGMIRKRAQFWVKFLGPVGVAWMTWYFFWVLLPKAEPALLAGNMQTGQWTVVFMAGGVCALLAKPKPMPPAKDQSGDGARTA